MNTILTAIFEGNLQYKSHNKSRPTCKKGRNNHRMSQLLPLRLGVFQFIYANSSRYQIEGSLLYLLLVRDYIKMGHVLRRKGEAKIRNGCCAKC